MRKANETSMTVKSSNLKGSRTTLKEICSCHPTGKKKKRKKSGLANQSISSMCHAIWDGIQSSYGVMEKVKKWLKEQRNRPEDRKMNRMKGLAGLFRLWKLSDHQSMRWNTRFLELQNLGIICRLLERQ